MLWQAWKAHNDLTHQDGPFDVRSSVLALQCLRSTLILSRQQGVEASEKGKSKIWDPGNGAGTRVREQAEEKPRWIPPTSGWVKVDVDGSYVQETGQAGVGIIARDEKGCVKLSSWRVLFNCSSPLEAEVSACVEGLQLAVEWIRGPIVLETDCAVAARILAMRDTDRSELMYMYKRAQELIGLMQQVEVAHVKREQNSVAHELAHLARRNRHTVVWLRQAPTCVSTLIAEDCNYFTS
ncbi:hypothetical protein PR202_gb00245 [Eleusine coracana subsp. coracana]|uniref:RNase H type-1 domain-containing protein n=1 Tax=Eleusine coracana subsp. coracana TaxID=191504 RepID=A0AAV5DT68_ELECO|nr:hypothetical protein PR202_gb00245 [Eleusine coracana subsp. coracana]